LIPWKAQENDIFLVTGRRPGTTNLSHGKQKESPTLVASVLSSRTLALTETVQTLPVLLVLRCIVDMSGYAVQILSEIPIPNLFLQGSRDGKIRTADGSTSN
jgi:hypothetical protein